MADVAARLNQLSDVVTSTGGRLLTTVALIGAALIITWVTRGVMDRSDRFRRAIDDVIVSFVAAAAFVTAGAFAIGVWGRAEALIAAIGRLNPGSGTVPRIAISIAILAATHVVSGFSRRVVEDFLGESDAVTEHQQGVIYRVTQVSLWIVAVIVVLGVWEVNLGGLLVGAGFLGIIIGMAARQTLGSLIAGFVLMFARPFEIGDWVEIGDAEGIVTDISIVNTRIQSFDGEYVMLPNDVVSGTQVINRSRKGRLRAEVEVGIDYAADPEHATEVAIEAVKDLDSVLSVPTPQAVIKEFGDSAVVIGIRFWIDKPSSRRRWRARTAVVTAIKRAFEREGIKIPFPQRELSGRAETGGFRVAETAEEPDSGLEPGERDAETAPDGGEGT